MRRMAQLAFVLFLAFPFWTLFFFFSRMTAPPWELTAEALQFSFQQALWSSLFSLLGGSLLGMALLRISSPRARQRWIYFCIGLSALPPLLWVSSAFSWWNFFGEAPRGLFIIAVTHAFMNLGLVAIAIEQMSRSRLGSFTEMALILSLSPWKFGSRVAFPLLRNDLMLLFYVIFVVCFSSFSVPLIFSSPQSQTLEVLIYNLGLRQSQWGQALALSTLQLFLLGIFSLVFGWFRWPHSETRGQWKWLVPPGCFAVALLPVIFLLGSLGSLALPLGKESFWQELLKSLTLERVAGTFALSLSVGGFTLLLGFFLCRVFPSALLSRFLRAYSAPSMALVGVVLFLLPGSENVSELLKVAAGLSVVSFPLLYRWMGESRLESLRVQVDQAQILGASPSQISNKILIPQFMEPLAWMAGVASLWAASDYALSRLVLQRSSTLALEAESALSSYRLEQGVFLSLLSVFVGFMVLLLLRRLFDVRN